MLKRALLFTLCCAAGCNESLPREKDFGSAGIVVTTSDGTQFTGAPMTIEVAEGALLPAQAAIAAYAADGRTWSAVFGLSLAQLSGTSVALARRPLAAGSGMV